ncbi:MAG: cytochrome c biogenesis protein CcsA [Candidatus Methanoperedens sp.]|nr:cytochrome c biogenesis protein CcsA [Candidatus Methanoperedens sp.]
MITLGDQILYASLAVGVITLISLLLVEFKNNRYGKSVAVFNTESYTGFINILSRFISPLVVLTTLLLSSAYILITYYFVTGNFTYDYVWQYSSVELPLVYKIAGVWAGQPGTYLMWVLVIFFSASWLSLTTSQLSAVARRTLIITVLIGVYFIILTLVQTPFKSIYEFADVPAGFIPADGSGLNALLVNFWMIVHPPVLFIGYAAMTIPFAAAIVYMLTREDGWEELARQWARFTWLFLGLGIAIGGIWAYVILGWGGFWAWDPVETASLVPWLSLTAFMHAAALHRKNKNTFSIAAPMLAAISFALVVYAAIVVRSGLFNSVHAFGDASTGSLLLGLLIVSTIVPVALGLWRYFSEPEKEDENSGLWTKTNLFFITLLLLIILTFISFWGITFPTVIQITQGVKIGVASDTKNFFNIWSYPFTLVLLLALGFCLNYKESMKEKHKKELLAVAVITIFTMFLRTENFYVLDHNSPFFVSEPFIYKMIGSISLLSIFPPMLYAFASTYKYLSRFLKLPSLRPKVKGLGIAVVHFGVVFILFGAVISSTQTDTISANIPLAAKGQLVDVGGGYGIKILDYSSHGLTEKKYPGTPIAEVLADPSIADGKTVTISGKVTDTNPLEGHGTLVELTDSSGSMWIAFQVENITLPEDLGLTVTGSILPGFETPVINPTGEVKEFTVSSKYNIQGVDLEVYKDNKEIGSGTAEYLEGDTGGSGTLPMVDPDFKGTDVYVIFQGLSGSVVPLTLKIIPAINFTWIGIILFSVGIILIMAVKTRKAG